MEGQGPGARLYTKRRPCRRALPRGDLRSGSVLYFQENKDYLPSGQGKQWGIGSVV